MEGDNPSLEQLLGDALRAFEGLRADYKRQNALRNLAVGVASLIAIVAVVTAVYAASSLAAYKRDNQRARVEACHQANAQQFRNRRAFKDSAEVLVAQVEGTTPEQERFIRRYRDATKAKAAADFPDRDCTPIGISRYLGQTAR